MSDSVLSSRPPTKSQYEWHDVRFIGAVAGRYVLSDRKTGEDGKMPVYACRLCSISTRLAVIVGPVVGEDKENVTAYLDEFGIVRGRIFRRLPSGFVLNLKLTDSERNKLGAKIHWYKRRVHEQLPDKREHKRILPRDPRSTLTLADGSTVPCFVVDISQSGAAISAQVWPDLGTPMALGRLVGRVVRYLDTGFALQFIQPVEADQVEVLMYPPSE